MWNTLEDHVLNQAATKLGFDKEEPNIKQGYGQNTSFKNLGYPQSHHQPDGWYIPNDKNVAIILETKRPSKASKWRGHKPKTHRPTTDQLRCPSHHPSKRYRYLI